MSAMFVHLGVCFYRVFAHETTEPEISHFDLRAGNRQKNKKKKRAKTVIVKFLAQRQQQPPYQQQKLFTAYDEHTYEAHAHKCVSATTVAGRKRQ